MLKTMLFFNRGFSVEKILLKQQDFQQGFCLNSVFQQIFQQKPLLENPVGNPVEKTLWFQLYWKNYVELCST